MESNTILGHGTRRHKKRGNRIIAVMIVLIIIVALVLVGVFVVAPKLRKPQEQLPLYSGYADTASMFDRTAMAFSTPATRTQAIDIAQKLINDAQIDCPTECMSKLKDITLFAIIQAKGKEAVIDTYTNRTAMHNDANYIAVMKRFADSQFARGDRNTAIVITTRYFTAKKSNPPGLQGMSDIDIYNIMIAAN